MNRPRQFQLGLLKISRRRAVQLIVVSLVMVAVVVLTFQMFHKAYRPVGNDFTSYLTSARAIVNGDNPYQTDSPFTYIYPMTLAFLLIPLTYIPYWLACSLWLVGNLLALYFSISIALHILSDKLKIPFNDELLPLLSLLFFLFLNVIQNHLLNGQVNLIVLLLCMLFLKYYLNQKLSLSVIFLSLAAAIKLVPIIFLLYLVVRKQARLALVTTLLFLLFCFLTYPILQEKTIYFYDYYLNSIMLDHLPGSSSQAGPTVIFSLTEFLVLLFPASINNLLASFIIIVGGMLIIIAIERRFIKQTDTFIQMGLFNTYLLTILLLFPMSEIHHIVFVLPVVVVLAVSAVFDRTIPTKTLVGTFLLSLITIIVGVGSGISPLILVSLILLFITQVHFLSLYSSHTDTT